MNMAEPLHFPGLRGDLRRDEPMARHVSWRAGGAARRFFAPADLEDLQAFLKTLAPEEPVLFVGLGACLVPTRRILAIEASEAMHAEG